jgi:ABC-type dipeptide/oligopeptide/nickel transport system ATPase component
VRELLQLRELTVELPTAAGWVKPVNGVSVGIPAGGSLVGESGSGKTMLSLALTPTHRNRPRADPPSEARRCGRTRLGP